MRSFLQQFLLLFVLTSCASGRPSTSVQILATTDLHGHLESGPEPGGVDVLHGYIKAARANDPETLLLDSGDLFQGTLVSRATRGQSVIAWMNAAGYSASAIGNHDFDFGSGESESTDRLAVLQNLMTEARFPLLAANICAVEEDPNHCADGKTFQRASWVKGYQFFTIHEKRIAILGLTTVDTPTTTLAANVQSLRFMPLAETVTRTIPELKARGADAIVLVAHVGGECAAGTCRGELFELLNALSPETRGEIHLVLGGHSHNLVNIIYKGVPVMIAGSYGRALGAASLEIDEGDVRVRTRLVDVCATVHADTGTCRSGNGARVPAHFLDQPVTPDMPAVVAAELGKTKALATETVGQLRAPVRVAPNGGSSSLGNLMVDALRWCDQPNCQTPAEVAFLNGGAVRVSRLPAGPIAFGQVFELSPFEDRLVRARLTGRQVRALLMHYRTRFGYFGLFSGLRVRSRNDVIVALETADGRPLADDQVYRVNLTEFLATGGDGVRDSVGPFAFEVQDGRTLRDMTVDLFKSHPEGLLYRDDDERLRVE